MGWKDIKLPKGCKLIKIHKFLYMANGVSYNLEIDEFADGMFTGHGEHASDESQQLKSVTGKSLAAPCISNRP